MPIAFPSVLWYITKMSSEPLMEMTRYVESLGDSARIRLPKTSEFSRADVVRAFAQSFELIGGVPRLALWAHQNESEFFKLYAKLLPSATVVDLNARVSHEIASLSTAELEAIVSGSLTIEHDNG
jgi:hypothetical protein